MSKVPWPQRPPDAGSEPLPLWRGSPTTAGDLSAERRDLHAVLLHGSLPADATADDRELLLLSFEELVSNGLRHGRPPVHVDVTMNPAGWLLDVSDAAVDIPPAPAVGRDAAAGGMGLYLVGRLAADYGWLIADDRKHVWARIDTAASRSERPGGDGLDVRGGAHP